MLEEQIKLIKQLGIKIVGIDYFTNSQTKEEKTISITFDDGWRIPKKTLEFLKKEVVNPTLFIYPTVIGNKSFFSWEELKKLNEEGFIIGSHSYSHKFLKGISDEELNREIIHSKEYIEKKLKNNIFSFAYPFGIADKKAYNLVSKTYNISFVVDDEPIEKIKPNKLSRYIIFNHTTLGQFREIIDNLYEKSNLSYKVYYIKSNVKGLYAKLYHFPVLYPEGSVMIVPSMSLGPSWIKQTIEKLREFNIEVWVFVNETYSFPFYKYEVYYERIKDISLKNVCLSLQKAIDIIGKPQVVLTWGDGFDIILQLTNSKISKIISVNPSLNGKNTQKEIESNIKLYKKLISEGKYDFESFKQNVQISVLLNLAFLIPNKPTPFKNKFGQKSNLQVFLEHINRNLNIKMENTTKLQEFIEKIQYSPFYTFSVVEPLNYYLEINELWLKLLKDPTSLKLPKTIILYNSQYAKNYETIKKIKNVRGNYIDLSTIEILLSEEFINTTISEVKNNYF